MLNYFEVVHKNSKLQYHFPRLFICISSYVLSIDVSIVVLAILAKYYFPTSLISHGEINFTIRFPLGFVRADVTSRNAFGGILTARAFQHWPFLTIWLQQ